MVTNSRPTLQDLLARATCGQRPDPKRSLKASMLYHLLADPYWVWCHYHAPPDRAVDEESDYDRARMKRGVDFEEQWVRENYPDAVKVEPAWGYEALVSTVKSMMAGARAIYQPQLWSMADELYGRGDLLLRVDGQPSDLGDYAYFPIEAKRSSQVKPYHAAQAAAYHKAVSAIQGKTMDTFEVALPSGQQVIRYSDHEKALGEAIDTWRAIRSGKLQPDPRGYDKTDSPWRVWSNQVLKDRLDLTLLPDVGPAGRETIRKKLGAQSIRDLFGLSLADVTKAMGETAGKSIYYCTQAYRTGKLVIPLGGTVSIPRGRRTFALDFETSDELAPAEAQPPHAYLAGLWDFDAEKFVRFVARGPGEEPRMFTEMLDYVGNLAGACVYTWTSYEMGVLRDAAVRHPALATRLAAFQAVCVDLKEVVKRQVYLPVPTYSIKSVAPALGFRWRHKGFGAFDSMVQYWKWVQGAPDDVMALAFAYHADDLLACAHVVRALDGLT